MSAHDGVAVSVRHADHAFRAAILRYMNKQIVAGFGSLTTPPCSPIVRWTVASTPITMSSEQIAAFTDVYSDTNRPEQPLAGRTIELTRPN